MDMVTSQLVQHQHGNNVPKQRPGMHLRGDCPSNGQPASGDSWNCTFGMRQECVDVHMLVLLQYESILVPVLAFSSRIVMGMPTPMLSWVTTMRPWLGYLAAALQPTQNACSLSSCCNTYATMLQQSGICIRSHVHKGQYQQGQLDWQHTALEGHTGCTLWCKCQKRERHDPCRAADKV